MAGLRRRRSSKSSAAAPGRSRRRSRVAPSQQRRPLIPIEAWLSGEGAGEKRLCLLSSSSRFSFFLFSGECFEERSGKVRATSPDDVFERKKKLVRGGQNTKTSGSASLFKKKKKSKRDLCEGAASSKAQPRTLFSLANLDQRLLARCSMPSPRARPRGQEPPQWLRRRALESSSLALLCQKTHLGAPSSPPRPRPTTATTAARRRMRAAPRRARVLPRLARPRLPEERETNLLLLLLRSSRGNGRKTAGAGSSSPPRSPSR